ncbi:hypothetical protein ACLOJK_040034 [Asimina triloba]
MILIQTGSTLVRGPCYSPRTSTPYGPRSARSPPEQEKPKPNSSCSLLQSFQNPSPLNSLLEDTKASFQNPPFYIL